jgi:hypothetical protein
MKIAPIRNSGRRYMPCYLVLIAEQRASPCGPADLPNAQDQRREGTHFSTMDRLAARPLDLVVSFVTATPA